LHAAIGLLFRWCNLRCGIKAGPTPVVGHLKSGLYRPARVKQMFANNDFHINRLVIVCNELLDMELADLVQITQDRQKYIEQLTAKQEQQLISDERLLVVSVSIMNNWTWKRLKL